MILLASKCDPISHWLLGKYAVGVPLGSFTNEHLLSVTACKQKAYPGVGIDGRGASGNIVGYVTRVAREEPDLDEVIRPLHRVPATAIRIE